MEVGAALYVLLAIAVGILATREFGRSGVGWFVLSVVLTPLAGLLLFLLQARRRPCPYCAELIRAPAALCRFCGREVVPLPERAALPARTRVVLGILVASVLLIALSQCHYRFQWWRGSGGIQVGSGQRPGVTGQWWSPELLGFSQWLMATDH